MRFFSHPRGIPSKLLCVFFLFLTANILFWGHARPLRLEWNNVPPVPSRLSALWTGLGDQQLAYRLYGLFIQNMGDTGGRVINLRQYDYEELEKWFLLQHELDIRPNFTPFLAAYFFGFIDTPEKLSHVVDYLEVVAKDDNGEKWRFLVQAIHLTRFKIGDLDRALDLANTLANFDNPDMPSWAKQMPALVLSAKGEKEAAFELMVSILQTERENLHPNEVNAMVDFICTRTLDQADPRLQAVCKDYESP